MTKHQPEPGLESHRNTDQPFRSEERQQRDAGPPNEPARCHVVDADEERGVPDELVGLWHAILRGELGLADWFYTPERWYLVLAPRAPAREVSSTCRRLLTRLLLGESQKRSSIEFGLSVSNLSSTLHRTLTAIGARVRPCKAPPMLALLARAGAGAETVRGRVSTLRGATLEYRIVSVARPEPRLTSVLSRAEYRVLCRLVEGRTYAEIAVERARSTRTVANQVAGVFRRLGVSGRAELIARLVADASSNNEAEPRGAVSAFR